MVDSVRILGEEYQIVVLDDKDSIMLETESDGYISYDEKCIYLLSSDTLIEHTFLHELVHGYLYEAGIKYGYGIHNEDNVDFIASMIPKVYRMFEVIKENQK